MNKITYYSQRYGLNINVKKTKIMIISKKMITEGQLYVNESPVERVTHYNYLGTIINEEWTPSRRLEQTSEKLDPPSIGCGPSSRVTTPLLIQK
ncbi:unnamed protein product [Diabrotica balteata]|uniref:Reverse transcriptase domain-containing protein n=1 Tax=Diabrotica balteata TaxID=107213 RepID=A0A9N9XIR6_DIABA|nr:unnamed protein product [Diabrotica balteata]